MSSPTVGQIWPRARTTSGSGGSVILHGTATPATVDGAVGDYYLDTDDNILYGPKVNPGPSEYVDLLPSASASSGSGTMLGMKYRFAVPGGITGVRFRMASGAWLAGAWKVYLYTAAGALLGSKDAPAGTGPIWQDVTFDTVVPVAANTTYVAAIWTPASGAAYLYSTSFTATTAGNVTAIAEGVDGVQGVGIASGGPGTFPNLDAGIGSFGISPIFNVAPTAWPVALKSVPSGGTTGQVLKKTSNTDFAVGWVT